VDVLARHRGGEPEQRERGDRGREEPSRGDPRQHGESRERRQREARQQAVRRAPAGRAGDDGEAGPDDRAHGEQPRPRPQFVTHRPHPPTGIV
jgi:hypothetical protein